MSEIKNMTSQEELKRKREKDHKWRKEHREKGLCVHCNKPAIIGKSACEFHLGKANKFSKNSYWENREHHLAIHQKHEQKLRKQALEKIAEFHGKSVQCFNCGCLEFKLLQIDHINGGGYQEIKTNWSKFIRAITKGERKLDDLAILCSVCNICKYANSISQEGKWKIQYSSNL